KLRGALLDLLLQKFLVVALVFNVGARPKPLHDGSGRIPHGSGARQVPAISCRRILQAVFHLEGLTRTVALLPHLQNHGPVIGMESVGPAPSQGLLPAEPAQLVPAAVAEIDAALGSRGPH